MAGAAGANGFGATQAISMGAPEAPQLPHPFSHSVITHHGDGSNTMHHINRQHGYVHAQPLGDGDVRGAAANHDAMLDYVMDHTGLEAE